MTGALARASRSRADDGFVLVTVMWLLGLLGALASAMALYAVGSVGTLDVYARRVEANAALEGGLNRAVATMLGGRQLAGQEDVTSGRTRVAASWTAETARIDVNYAPAPLLAGLFAGLGATANAAEGYADLIVGLRGLPPEQKRVPGSAYRMDETPAAIYAAAHRLDAKPDPHRPFVDVAQLAEVAGLPPDLMARAAPFLTTYSGIATVDPRICAPEVVEALPDMTRERLRTVLAVRAAAEGGELDDALGPSKPFTSSRGASSVRFRLRADLPGGVSMAAEIVVVPYPRDRVPFRIVSWDEDAPASDARRAGP